MIICTPCKTEMTCSRTGVTAVWNGNHGYAGDEYICPRCFAITLVTNPSSYVVSPLQFQALESSQRLLEMN